MARRALGVLPTTEPLKPSRFAPAAVSTPETSLGPDPQSGLETFLEIEASGPRPITTPVPRGQTVQNRSFPEPERREADAAAPLRPRVAPPPPNDVLEPEPERPARPTRLRAVAPKIAAKPADALEEDSKPSGADEAALPPARIAAEDRRPLNKAVPRDLADAPETARMRTRAAHAALAEQAANEPVSRMARRNAPAGRAPRERSREPAAPATPVDPKMEIHISIGAIELRAARPAPVSAAQPFRPRVTLEDFLRRKPGVSG